VLIQPWYDLSVTFLSLQITTKSKTTSAVLRSCEVFWLNKQTKKTDNSCGTASQVIYKQALLLFTLCSLSLRQRINCISIQFMGLELVLDSGSNFQPDSNSTLIQ